MDYLEIVAFIAYHVLILHMTIKYSKYSCFGSVRFGMFDFSSNRMISSFHFPSIQCKRSGLSTQTLHYIVIVDKTLFIFRLVFGEIRIAMRSIIKVARDIVSN